MAWDVSILQRVQACEIIKKNTSMCIIEIRDRHRVKEIFKFIRGLDISATIMDTRSNVIACLCPKAFVQMQFEDDASNIQIERSFILKENVDPDEIKVINMECDSRHLLGVSNVTLENRSMYT